MMMIVIVVVVVVVVVDDDDDVDDGEWSQKYQTILIQATYISRHGRRKKKS